jgi:hypothetical protein
MSCTLFPHKNCYLLLGIQPTSQVSSVRKFTTVENRSFQVNGRSTVSVGRKPSMLEEVGSSTLFSLWELRYLVKRILVIWKCFEVGESFSFWKIPSLTKWRNTCILWNKTICVRCRSFIHIVSLGELRYLLKGILPTSQGFQVWETSPLCKIGPFSQWNKQYISWKKIINVRCRRV